jgi:hypothetical protein
MLKTLTLTLVALLFIACSYKKHASSVNSLKTGKYTKLKHFEGDTLQYVTRNFVNRKDKYIGKKLKELLKDVEIPILSFVYGSSIRGLGKIPSLILYFYPDSEISRKRDQYEKPSSIIIKWRVGLPADKVVKLGRKNKGKWDPEAMDYYGEQIIGDVLTSKWVK